MKTPGEIKSEVEAYLLKGNVFDYILRSNSSLYEDKLKLLFKEEDLDSLQYIESLYYFKCDPSYLKFTGESNTLKLEKNGIKDIYEFLYISDFEYDGFISQNDYSEAKVQIVATVRIFTIRQSGPDFQPPNTEFIVPDIINVCDRNSYEIWDRKDRNIKISELQKYLKIKLKS